MEKVNIGNKVSECKGFTLHSVKRTKLSSTIFARVIEQNNAKLKLKQRRQEEKIERVN